MIIKQSPLKVLDFLCLENRLKFISPIEEVVPIELFQQYEIDFDFAQTHNNEHLQVYVKVSINDIPTPMPGYKIFTEAVGLFGLNEEGLSIDDINNFKNYTALIITINHLRNFISNLTSYSPMGKFVLPSIDMVDLMNKKMKPASSINKKGKVHVKKGR